MQVPILVEPIDGGRYRARAGEPFAMSAEGSTKLEAYQALERMVLARIDAGAELHALELPPIPAKRLATGLGKDNPLWGEFLAGIAANRRHEELAQL